jgi:acyl-CoA thioesterase-1
LTGKSDKNAEKKQTPMPWYSRIRLDKVPCIVVDKSIDERGGVFIGGLMRMTKILRQAAVGIAATFLVLLAAACEYEVNEERPSLEKWDGTWNSLSSYLDETAMESVYETFAQTISTEVQRTIGAPDVKELVKKVFHTDFASLKVEGNTITFYRSQNAKEDDVIAPSAYTFKREVSDRTFDWYGFEGSGDYRYWIADPPKNGASQGSRYFFFAYDSADFEKAIGITVAKRPAAVPAETTVDQAVAYLKELMSQISIFLAWGRGETLVCLGDSLTAGYGAGGSKKEDRLKSYPAYLEGKVKMPVINKGVSGDSSAGGLSRINSILETENPRILIIELGANDYLLWNVPVNKTHENLQAIIDRANDGQRKIYLAKFYTEQVAKDLEAEAETIKQYDAMFNALASEDNVELINDIWADVWGKPEYMSDAHHPNAGGYKIMADNYFKAMEPYLTTNGLAAE